MAGGGLFYSNQKFNLKTLFREMSAASGIRSPAAVRDIDKNKYLIEFDSMRTFEYVTMGGPWTF